MDIKEILNEMVRTENCTHIECDECPFNSDEGCTIQRKDIIRLSLAKLAELG